MLQLILYSGTLEKVFSIFRNILRPSIDFTAQALSKNPPPIYLMLWIVLIGLFLVDHTFNS